MASIALTTGGTVLNAVAFISGNYLARFLSGNDPRKKKKSGMPKLSRPTRRLMPNIKKTEPNFSIGSQQMIGSKIRRNKISLIPTTLSNSTTKPNKTNKSQHPKSRSSLTFISLVNSKNKANSCLSALAPLRLGTLHFVSFELENN